MKATFIGGGSFRILPIARGVLADPRVLADGEIALYDPNVARAEAMGRMIMRTPEYAQVGCKVTWGMPLEAALEGADAVQLGFPAGDPVLDARMDAASHRYGFMSSDNVSPTGAFLALRTGPIILDYARKMERYCPQAWFCIFANPVAVYSALVNNHTRIRALGVCGGFQNHMYDLTRLMGRDAHCPDFDVSVAGINHLSFILRGTYQGRDLYELLGEYLTDTWQPPAIGEPWTWLEGHITYALRKLKEMYHQFGTMIFSTEGDGMTHLFYEEMYTDRRPAEHHTPTPAELAERQARARTAREEADRRFRAHLDEELDEQFWNDPHRHFGRSDHDATVRVLKALGGGGRQKLVTSYVNTGGAVANFPARTALEYSHYLDPDGLTPEPNLYVPAPFFGLIAALATHQTLLADAIATEDPYTLFHALYTYPVKQNTRDARALYRELLEINRDVISPAFQQTHAYLA